MHDNPSAVNAHSGLYGFGHQDPPPFDDDADPNAKVLSAAAKALSTMKRRKWAGMIETAAALLTESPDDCADEIRKVLSEMYDAANDPSKRRGKIDPADVRYSTLYEQLDEIASQITAA